MPERQPENPVREIQVSEYVAWRYVRRQFAVRHAIPWLEALSKRRGTIRHSLLSFTVRVPNVRYLRRYRVIYRYKIQRIYTTPISYIFIVSS